MKSHFQRFAAFAVPACVAALSLFTGCSTQVVQTNEPRILYSEPPSHAVPAKFRGRDVHVTYSRTARRPARGWLVVERFPDDPHVSVVPAYPYSAYEEFHGVVSHVYADGYQQPRRLITVGTQTASLGTVR